MRTGKLGGRNSQLGNLRIGYSPGALVFCRWMGMRNKNDLRSEQYFGTDEGGHPIFIKRGQTALLTWPQIQTARDAGCIIITPGGQSAGGGGDSGSPSEWIDNFTTNYFPSGDNRYTLISGVEGTDFTVGGGALDVLTSTAIIWSDRTAPQSVYDTTLSVQEATITGDTGCAAIIGFITADLTQGITGGYLFPNGDSAASIGALTPVSESWTPTTPSAPFDVRLTLDITSAVLSITIAGDRHDTALTAEMVTDLMGLSLYPVAEVAANYPFQPVSLGQWSYVEA